MAAGRSPAVELFLSIFSGVGGGMVCLGLEVAFDKYFTRYALSGLCFASPEFAKPLEDLKIGAKNTKWGVTLPFFRV
jgi:hypothetical protein